RGGTGQRAVGYPDRCRSGARQGPARIAAGTVGQQPSGPTRGDGGHAPDRGAGRPTGGGCDGGAGGGGAGGGGAGGGGAGGGGAGEPGREGELNPQKDPFNHDGLMGLYTIFQRLENDTR